MCTVCGCGQAEVKHGHDHAHDHPPHDHSDHGHGHDHGPHHHHHGTGAAGVSVPGMSQERLVAVERDILEHNDQFAQANRTRLSGAGVFALNLVSSPGSGKTTLLVHTIAALQETLPITVIEGDQQTDNDAERIRATGVPAIQVNTGKGCHLDAHMVGHALDHLTLSRGGLLFIENVGNLVCPAGFDLGEAHKVVILSVTEGEDKPLKYPDMFAAADLMILAKADLLPHVRFDAERCVALARQVNPDLEVLTLSAETGAGMPAWLDWLHRRGVPADQRAAS